MFYTVFLLPFLFIQIIVIKIVNTTRDFAASPAYMSICITERMKTKLNCTVVLLLIFTYINLSHCKIYVQICLPFLVLKIYYAHVYQ